MHYDNPDFSGSMLLGYASMILAFAFVFVGTKNYRDKYNGGTISFGKAFKIGILITLVSSTMYVLTWLVEYYVFLPDFMEKYTVQALEEARASGASAAEIEQQAAEMAGYSEMYKNPLFVVLLTYAEIFPIGLLMTLISSFILKRKPQLSDNKEIHAAPEI
jgi:hypothetical protein